MPLVNLLVPQLLRKAQEIESQIGPPGAAPVPPVQGYLQAGYEKTPYDPKGLVDKPDSKQFDPDTAVGRELNLMGGLQRSENPYTRSFANAYLMARDGTNPPPQPMPTSPAAPMRIVKKGDKVGTKNRVFAAKPGEAIGVNEQGEATDVNGRPVKGYLYTPSIETPSGSTPMRNADRRDNDVSGNIWDNDAFSNEAMERRYGKHYQEWNDYRGANKDGFPDDYFKGVSTEDRKRIIDGVKELSRRHRLNATTGEGGRQI